MFQARKCGNRHLVALRPVKKLPAAKRIDKILVMAPEELLASKVIAYHQRRGKPKSGTDWRDLAMLLLAFPDLKQGDGAVADRLLAAGVDPSVLQVWRNLAAQEIKASDEDDEF